MCGSERKGARIGAGVGAKINRRMIKTSEAFVVTLPHHYHPELVINESITSSAGNQIVRKADTWLLC